MPASSAAILCSEPLPLPLPPAGTEVLATAVAVSLVYQEIDRFSCQLQAKRRITQSAQRGQGKRWR